MGGATYFLGMEVTRDWEAGTLKLMQKKLTGELLGKVRNGVSQGEQRANKSGGEDG
jgi:hypothetical protein